MFLRSKSQKFLKINYNKSMEYQFEILGELWKVQKSIQLSL